MRSGTYLITVDFSAAGLENESFIFFFPVYIWTAAFREKYQHSSARPETVIVRCVNWRKNKPE